MRRILTIGGLLTLLLLPATAGADDLDELNLLTQRQFRGLSQDLAGALAYRSLSPAEPLGPLGFEAGIDIGYTKVEHEEAWEQATGGESVDGLPLARVRLTKGLPLGVDVGLSYMAVPGSNVESWGGEIRYALLEAGVTLPAVGLRGSHVALSGVDQLDLSTTSVDVVVSKGVLFLTPYAGLGRLWVDSDPDVAGLEEESFSDSRVFVGTRIAMPFVSAVLEADRVAEVTTYSVKLAFGL